MFVDLLGIRTSVDGVWWGGVCMCQPTVAISSVLWAHGSLVAHGRSPSHSSRPIM